MVTLDALVVVTALPSIHRDLGGSIGTLQWTLNTYNMAVAPVSLGKAAGVLNTLQQFGAVFGIAIVTAVFNSNGSLAGPAAVTAGFRPAVAVSAGLSSSGQAPVPVRGWPR